MSWLQTEVEAAQRVRRSGKRRAPGANWQALYGSAIGIAGQAERIDLDEHQAFLAALLGEDA